MVNSIEESEKLFFRWIEQACDSGWLVEKDKQRAISLKHSRPTDLFKEQKHRPMVVGFYGGTGVGKSSILNRLAKDDIAKVGVERPTSHEVTLYIHNEQELSKLPEHLPLNSTKIEFHANNDYKKIVWIDMPDIDSTNLENRDLCFAWLEYIDLLIYVVSPERYKDDLGWKVLKQRTRQHAWLFAMNHWDQGNAQQIDDLQSILSGAGFKEPVVLRTSCTGETDNQGNDDFKLLVKTVDQMLQDFGVDQFDKMQQRLFIESMLAYLVESKRVFGENTDWHQFAQALDNNLSTFREAVLNTSQWSIENLAKSFDDKHTSSFIRLARPVIQLIKHPETSGQATETGNDLTMDRMASIASRVWDTWSQTKLNDVLLSWQSAIKDSGISFEPVHRSIKSQIEQFPEMINQEIELSLRKQLANPGNMIQRFLLRLTRIARMLFPLAAVIWVAYHTWVGFQAGVAGERQFYGLDFAVNSVLLILISWLLPYILGRYIQPTLQKTVANGLNLGLRSGLDKVASQLTNSVSSVSKQRNEFLEKLKQLQLDLNSQLTSTDGIKTTEVVQRTLVNNSIIGQDTRTG